MSPSSHDRNIRGNTLAIVAAATVLVGGSIGIYKGVTSGGGGTPGAGLANVWIDPGSGSDNGANCVRSATPAADPGGAVCQSIPKAYTLASPGDKVLIRSGTFTTQQLIDKNMRKADGSACHYLGSTTGCITFEPATGATVSFNVPGNPVSAFSNCGTYVYLKNVTFTQTTYVDEATSGDVGGHTVSNYALGQGNGGNFCGTTPPHDNIYQSINFGGQVGIVGGSYNTCVVNSIAVSVYNKPWQFAGTGDNGAIAAAHDLCLIGNRFQGYAFVNESLDDHHMECMHAINAGANYVIRNNQFLDCPVEGLFFQIEGVGVFTNALIEGNVFSGGSNLLINCHSSGCTVNNNTIRFNTFYNNSTWMTCGSGGCTMSGNTFYGNLNGNCPGSTVGTASSYNVYTAASCSTDNGTSLLGQTISFTSVGSPNYNYALSGCSQGASDFVAAASVAGYPTTDLLGQARPKGLKLDAGAYETCGASGFGTGGSLATCSQSPCTTGTTQTITVNTNDGAGKAVAWKSQIYVPGGMSGNAPLMIIFAGPVGTASAQDWVPVANNHRFIWMKFWCKPGCADYSGFPSAGGAHFTCGASGTAQCDDKVALVATINYVEANYPVDQTKLYATGDSKGGWMTMDVMCGDNTNRLFRGYAPASSLFTSPAKNLPLNCDAADNGNTDFSLEYLWGTVDTGTLGTGAGEVCTTPAAIIETGCFKASKNWWVWAPIGAMNQARTDYGCTSTNTIVAFGPTGKWVRQMWATCPVSPRAVASLKIVGGGHAFGGLDNVDGFNPGDEIYTWLSTH